MNIALTLVHPTGERDHDEPERMRQRAAGRLLLSLCCHGTLEPDAQTVYDLQHSFDPADSLSALLT
jgi:hypothetical protein